MRTVWKLLFFYFFALKRYLNVNFDGRKNKDRTVLDSVKGNPGSNEPNIKKVKI